MSQPTLALPESTGLIAIHLLRQARDSEAAISWARDLWQQGRDSADIVALSVLSTDEGTEADRLLKRIVGEVGLNEPTSRHYWIERWLLRHYLLGAWTEADLLREGYEVWVQVMESDAVDRDNAFSIYNELGDLAHLELGHWDLGMLPPKVVRAWVLQRLTADSAFDRAGLEPPR